MNYYNEFNPYAAEWLRIMIEANLIPPGVVDETDIRHLGDVDLSQYSQCHFFAGIGGWSQALKLAGWPEDKPVWTGSCPCQPFSGAIDNRNERSGTNDERHLWPSWFDTIRKHKPPIVFGEQVKDAIGHGWLDDVFMDFETQDYACAAAVLPANAFQIKHERKRLYFVAHSIGIGRETSFDNGEHFQIKNEKGLNGLGKLADITGRILEGDFRDIWPSDGLSPVMEREAIRCYGNAIVPQVAAEFILSAAEAVNEAFNLRQGVHGI